MSTGWVYVLSNPSIPSQVKVGWTKGRPEGRAKELQATGVPTPFKVETAFLFSNRADVVERKSHEFLREVRVSFGREFFKCDPRFAAQKILEAAEAIGEQARDVSPVLITAAQRRQVEEEKKRVVEKEKARKAKEARETENKKRRQEEHRRAVIQKKNEEEAERQRQRNEILNKPPTPRVYYASKCTRTWAAIVPMFWYSTVFLHFPLFISLEYSVPPRDSGLFVVLAGGSAMSLLILLILVAFYLDYKLNEKQQQVTFLCRHCGKGFDVLQKFWESTAACPHCGTVNTIPGDSAESQLFAAEQIWKAAEASREKERVKKRFERVERRLIEEKKKEESARLIPLRNEYNELHAKWHRRGPSGRFMEFEEWIDLREQSEGREGGTSNKYASGLRKEWSEFLAENKKNQD